MQIITVSNGNKADKIVLKYTKKGYDIVSFGNPCLLKKTVKQHVDCVLVKIATGA